MTTRTLYEELGRTPVYDTMPVDPPKTVTTIVHHRCTRCGVTVSSLAGNYIYEFEGIRQHNTFHDHLLALILLDGRGVGPAGIVVDDTPQGT